jgi:uncharacterized protein YndB with AHSA1/START domain
MRYILVVEETVEADPAALWQAWTDMPRFPSWDPREEETTLDGPFGVGVTGWSKQRGTPRSPFTVTAVEPGRPWQVQTPLPAGKLVIDHVLHDARGGRLRLVKRYEAQGPMAIPFRLYYARKIRRETPMSFAALAAEAGRLQADRPA